MRHLQHTASLLVAGLTIAACIEVPKPNTALEAKQIKTSAGVSLQTTCTPSGVEICFDAIDNNCNGVIDEGCGIHTGILQFTAAWQESNADVDLNVTGPNKQVARLDEPNIAGLVKDRDCPNNCYGQNVENVYLAEGKPRRGRYRIIVRLEELGDATPPIKVRLSARIGQSHFSSVVELKRRSEEREFEFTL